MLRQSHNLLRQDNLHDLPSLSYKYFRPKQHRSKLTCSSLHQPNLVHLSGNALSMRKMSTQLALADILFFFGINFIVALCCVGDWGLPYVHITPQHWTELDLQTHCRIPSAALLPLLLTPLHSYLSVEFGLDCFIRYFVDRSDTTTPSTDSAMRLIWRFKLYLASHRSCSCLQRFCVLYWLTNRWPSDYVEAGQYEMEQKKKEQRQDGREGSRTRNLDPGSLVTLSLWNEVHAFADFDFLINRNVRAEPHK